MYTESRIELFFFKIMSLLCKVMTLIDDNINIAIILKLSSQNIFLNSGVKKLLEKTNFMLVLIAELICAFGSDTFLRDLYVLPNYRLNKRNHSTFALCRYKMLSGGIKTIAVHSLTSIMVSQGVVRVDLIIR